MYSPLGNEMKFSIFDVSGTLRWPIVPFALLQTILRFGMMSFIVVRYREVRKLTNVPPYVPISSNGFKASGSSGSLSTIGGSFPLLTIDFNIGASSNFPVFTVPL